MNSITRGALSAGALALTAILTVGGGVPAASATPVAAPESHQRIAPGQSETQLDSTSQGTLDQEPATEDESTGIVLIDTEMGYKSAAAAGTGIVLDDQGTILTNNHVIADSTSISVTAADTGQTYEATVVGSDSTQDVAVLTIDPDEGGSSAQAGSSAASGSSAPSESGSNAQAEVGSDTGSDSTLEPADISDDDVRVGDAVTAVGNAGGAGELQAADGTVTALDASVTTAAEGSAESESLTGMIEVDADIVSGDSGGALLDEDGDVVGVNTAASQGSADITGFAIPIDEALDIAQNITDGVQTETNTLGYPAFLGVALTSPQTSVPADGSTFRQRGWGWSDSSQSPDSGQSSGFGGPESDSATASASGAIVGGVYEHSPAAAAGLAARDTITAVDGTGVADSAELADLLGRHAPGDQVEITWVDSSGSTHTSTVTLTEGPAA